MYQIPLQLDKEGTKEGEDGEWGKGLGGGRLFLLISIIEGGYSRKQGV